MLNSVPYTADGYLDMGQLLPHVLPFCWIWGGRGIGKTYGVLKNVRYDNPRPFILMRRTQKQIEMIYNPRLHPFKTIDRDTGGKTAIVKDGDIGVFYNGVEDENGEVTPQGPPVGYAIALSTIYNVRGIDLSDVKVLVFDEFIPEVRERSMKGGEYIAFKNAYETINRNRELQGEPPLQLIALTNSNSLGNPYFLGMRVIRVVDTMVKKKREIWTDPSRGLMLINILRTPISERKAKTALYLLDSDDDYSNMALGNEYSLDYCSNQGSFPLRELIPVCGVGEICVYKHKSLSVVYVSSHFSGSPAVYGADDTNLMRFRHDYWALWKLYLDHGVVFQDIMCEILWKKYWK